MNPKIDQLNCNLTFFYFSHLKVEASQTPNKKSVWGLINAYLNNVFAGTTYLSIIGLLNHLCN